MSLLHCSQSRRAIIASTVGITVEWYDFLLYGIVTGLVFGKLFFPESDPLVGGRVARRADCDRASRLDWIGLTPLQLYHRGDCDRQHDRHRPHRATRPTQ